MIMVGFLPVLRLYAAYRFTMDGREVGISDIGNMDLHSLIKMQLKLGPTNDICIAAKAVQTKNFPFSVLPPEISMKILGYVYQAEVQNLNVLRRVSRKWNDMALYIADKDFRLERMWRKEFAKPRWKLVFARPALVTRVFADLPFYKHAMSTGQGTFFPTIPPGDGSFIPPISYLFDPRVDFKWNPDSLAFWSPTRAFFHVLNEHAVDAFPRFFPESAARAVADTDPTESLATWEWEGPVTWEVFKYKLDRTIYYDDDAPAVRRKAYDEFNVARAVKRLQDELPTKLKVEFTKAVRGPQREFVHDMLDWKKIEKSYKIGDDILAMKKNGLTRFLRGRRQYQYRYLKREYWIDGIPDHMFVDE